MSSDSLVIGIDLGTTNSCASCYIDGNLKVLENKEGGRVTPSFLFYTKRNKPIVGHYAKQMAEQKPEHSIYGMKRLIGRDFQDKRVQEKRKFYPFLIEQVDGELVVGVEVGDQILNETPQELTSLVLKKIKADVDERLDSNITKAVITVPAYFNSLQRKKTLEAAKKVGFDVLKLLNEPNAVALNCFYENPNDSQYLLVYDLGGGTFDVSILKKSGSNVEVLCVDGDSHLGGDDFDDLIVNYVCDELLKNHNMDVMKNDKRNWMQLNAKCEVAKKALSVIEETNIYLDVFVKNHDRISIPLSRKRFEDMIENLLKKTLDLTIRCIRDSKIKKEDIEQVILAGGSTRIPKIQDMLSDYFGTRIVKKTVNPDECVALGAALQAAMLSKHPRQSISKKTKIVDVVPLSIGVLIYGVRMDTLIKKNTPIPVSVTYNLCNVKHKQPVMNCRIYEGERLDCRKNNELGNVAINLTPSPPRECSVSLTVHIDSTGILSLAAEEEISGNRKEATVDFYTIGIRSDSEVKEAIEDAENSKAEDEKFRAYSDRIIYLKNYCAAIIHNLTEKNLDVAHKDVFARCKQIEKNLTRSHYFYESKIIQDVVDKLTEKCDQFVRHYKFEKMPTMGV